MKLPRPGTPERRALGVEAARLLQTLPSRTVGQRLGISHTGAIKVACEVGVLPRRRKVEVPVLSRCKCGLLLPCNACVPSIDDFAGMRRERA